MGLSPAVAAIRRRTLPQVLRRNRLDAATRARLRAQGLDLNHLPVDKAEPFMGGGHGTTARRLRHLRDGETPCVSCQAAEHSYRYPGGNARPFGWTLERN